MISVSHLKQTCQFLSCVFNSDVTSVSLYIAFDFFFKSYRLQDLVERFPLMPILKKILIFIHFLQSLAAVLKIAKFILHSIYIWLWFMLVFVSTILLKVAKLQYFTLAPYCQI